MDIERRNKKGNMVVHVFLWTNAPPDIVSTYYYKYMHKEPYMTSSQTREAWKHPTVFLKLRSELE